MRRHSRGRLRAHSPLVDELHLAEIDPAGCAEMVDTDQPGAATDRLAGHRREPAIDAVVGLGDAREDLHYPMTKAALESGKHVLLEKPIALTLDEADELIAIADARQLKFTIGYSQRFNAKQAMVKRAINDGRSATSPASC